MLAPGDDGDTARGRSVIGEVGAAELHVTTWNIRRAMPGWWLPSSLGPDRWARRAPALAAALRAEQPAVLCVQEALPEQLVVVRDALGARYEQLGVGRSRGRDGEHCSLLVDTHRLDVGGWEQVALSDRPHEPGSRVRGSLFPRVAVLARLIHRATGTRLTVANSHLDPFPASAGRTQARMLVALAEAAPDPVVVTLDANAGPGSETYRILTAGLADSWTTAATRCTPEWATHSGYRALRRGRRIDLVLTSPALVVDRVAIGTAEPGAAHPSDHEPAHAVLRLDAASRIQGHPPTVPG